MCMRWEVCVYEVWSVCVRWGVCEVGSVCEVGMCVCEVGSVCVVTGEELAYKGQRQLFDLQRHGEPCRRSSSCLLK